MVSQSTKFEEKWLIMKSEDNTEFPTKWAKYRQEFLDDGWVKGSSTVIVEGWVLELIVKPILE
jgi:hypothetical protein